MMTLLSYLFTFLLIVDCLLLGLLVLVQLPKKEAGVGMAFGGGAADALFGAGSGTALTKLTKYCAIIFFLLVIALCMIDNNSKTSAVPAFKRGFEQAGDQQQPAVAPSATTPTGTSSAPALISAGSNAPQAPALAITNAPASNAPATPVK